MQNLHRTPNTIKSLTLKLSLADGVMLASVQGKRYRITVPLNGLVFDNHGAAPAWFYAVWPLQLGSGTAPAPSGVRLVGHSVIMHGLDADDSRKAIVSRVVFDIEIDEDAATLGTIPLVMKGHAVATNAPASFSLPAFTPSEDSEFAVVDSDGGGVLLGIEEIAMAAGGDGVFTAIASQAEAQAGVNNTKGMTPLRTAQAIAELASGGGGGVTSVGATAPLSSTGGATPTLSIAAASGSVAGSMSAASFTKLGGIATGATANDSDSNLKNRANHTGSQAISTVSGLQSALDGKAATSHTHDDRYYTEAETDSLIAVKADLVGGVVPTSQLPAIALGETFTVVNQSAMLALTAQHGDVAIRTDDGNKKYMLLDDDPTELANWTVMGTGNGDVNSVNGQTGTVVLGYADVGAAPASTATSLSSHTSDTANPHSVTKSQVGLGNVDNTADSSKSFTATQISDSTSVGRGVVTAANAAAARTAIGAGTGNGDVTLTGSQTLTNKTLTSPVINSPSGFLTGAAKITVGTTAPSSPSVGDIWIDTN